MNNNEQWIAADNAALQYSGRIDFDDPKEPVWVFPATYVKVRFTGDHVRAVVTNMRGCWDNFLGVLLDGVQSTLPLAPSGRQELTLGENLGPGVHELTLFKRQDSCHQLRFHGLILSADAVLSAPEPLPKENGRDTIVCRELLGLKKGENAGPEATPRTPEFYQKRPCPALIRLAADILEQYIAEHPIPTGDTP